MSSLEDLGFQMFSSRGDTTGAVVTTSAGEMWIGGALALGAVFGAVYAWPKMLKDTAPTPAGVDHEWDFLTIKAPDLKTAHAALRGDLPADTPEDFLDIKYRARGYEPTNLHGDNVLYLPIDFESVVLPESVADRLMAGDVPTEEEVRAEVEKLAEKDMAGPHNPASLRGLRAAWSQNIQDTVRKFQGVKDLSARGFEPVQSVQADLDPGFVRVRFAPGRCMIHRECRNKPDLGRACLMAQWDERWKEGAK